MKARQFLQSNDLEIWQGARMVSRLNAQDRVTAERPVKAVTQHDVYSQNRPIMVGPVRQHGAGRW